MFQLPLLATVTVYIVEVPEAASAHKVGEEDAESGVVPLTQQIPPPLTVAVADAEVPV